MLSGVDGAHAKQSWWSSR